MNLSYMFGAARARLDDVEPDLDAVVKRLGVLQGRRLLCKRDYAVGDYVFIHEDAPITDEHNRLTPMLVIFVDHDAKIDPETGSKIDLIVEYLDGSDMQIGQRTLQFSWVESIPDLTDLSELVRRREVRRAARKVEEDALKDAALQKFKDRLSADAASTMEAFRDSLVTVADHPEARELVEATIKAIDGMLEYNRKAKKKLFESPSRTFQ